MLTFRNTVAVVLAVGIGLAPATPAIAADGQTVSMPSALSTLTISSTDLSTVTQPSPTSLALAPSFASMAASSAAAQRGRYRGGRYGRGGGNRGTAAGALILGTGAMITGAALLTYANRPDCHNDSRASGCGYGTKVVGASVLTGGVVGVAVGAALWR